MISNSHIMNSPSETPGAQNMRRSLQILRVLGHHQEDGIAAVDVMAATGLERSTSHRLLTCLVEERFAERDPLTRRYRLGLEAMQLGLAALRRAPLVDAYTPLMLRVARLSEDTVYLLMRQGDYTVCLHREDGAFPVKIFSTRVGDVRPLGVGVGGMAMLAAASDEEIARIQQHHAAAFEAAGLGPAQLARTVARTRRTGVSELVDSVTAGVAGVGVVIPHGTGPAFAAITIASITPRMVPARRAELGQMLLRELAGGDAG